jgi:O-glycosyl hydrolase
MLNKIIRLFALITILITLTNANAQIVAESWTTTVDLSRKLDQDTQEFRDRAYRKLDTITIDDTKTFQTIVGLGSSLEPTTCYNLSLLPEEDRRKVIRNLVHPTRGIGMNLMRVCIGTPDFTGDEWYTYHDELDPDLNSFSIDRDKAYILPILKIALEENPDLKFYASPWSPPGWMTTTNNMIGGTLKPEYYDAYARYFVKFIRAYESEGIPIHAITIQNEPGVDRSKEEDPKWFYPSCRWNGEQERDFIVNHLGPQLEKEDIDTEIWCYDHNYNVGASSEGDDPGISYPRTILSDPNAAQYVDKVAFHGYVGSPRGMSTFHKEFPNTPVLFTEGSVFGTKGARKIIDLFQNSASSYNAWVTIIDENKGPNNGPFEASKTCITLDTKSLEVEYHFDYYMYGQFMHFIQSGARRIQCKSDIKNIYSVAFKNPDGTTVFIAVNTTPQDVTFSIDTNGQHAKVELEGNSITTLRWK